MIHATSAEAMAQPIHAREAPVDPKRQRPGRPKRPAPREAALCRALAEATGSVLLVLDSSRGMVTPDSGWSSHTGQSERDCLAHGYLDAIHPADRPHLLTLWAEASLAQRPLELEVRVWNARISRHGRCAIRAQPILGKRALDAWVLLLRDLEHEQRRIRAISDAVEAAETSRMEALRSLARGVAHQMNNLMHGLLLQAEVLRRHGPNLAGPAAMAIQHIVRSTERGADFARQLMAFAGLDAPQGRAEISTALIAMGSTLRALCGPNAQFRLALDTELGSVQADEHSLMRVAFNLVQNASEALGNKGGTILVRAARRDLRTTDLEGAQPATAKPGQYICMEVADDGPGISSATRERIFEPFHTSKLTGRGLGLPATLGIVRSWGGFMQIVSEAGEGTRVRVLVPCEARTPATAS